MATFCLGFMGFSAVTFFLSLYLQEVKHLTALDITVRLLPMVVSGVLVNVVCGLILHRVSNKLLTGIGALAYTASFLILSFMNENASYWAYIFPALVLVVVGADIQFNVTNVSASLPPNRFCFCNVLYSLDTDISRCMSCHHYHHHNNPSPAASSTPSASYAIT